MSDPKINGGNTGLRVEMNQTLARQTVKDDFGTVLGQGLNRSADMVASATQLAAPFVPGAAAVHAAISGVRTLQDKAGSPGGRTTSVSGASTSISPTATGLGTTGTAVTAGTGGAGGTNAAGMSNDPMVASKQLMEMNQSFNMQYLMLQQKMQDESRRYTMISNVIKTKHDTAKNAISNVR
jgi:hypothetical protein